MKWIIKADKFESGNHRRGCEKKIISNIVSLKRLGFVQVHSRLCKFCCPLSQSSDSDKNVFHFVGSMRQEFYRICGCWNHHWSSLTPFLIQFSFSFFACRKEAVGGRTLPLWRVLVKILTKKTRHNSSFSLECTDFKNVIFEKIPWAPSEFAKVEWRSMFKFHEN